MITDIEKRKIDLSLKMLDKKEIELLQKSKKKEGLPALDYLKSL